MLGKEASEKERGEKVAQSAARTKFPSSARGGGWGGGGGGAAPGRAE